MIVSYFITERPFDDPNYDPFPEDIYIHDNSFSGGGASPDSEPLNLLKQATGQDIPDIVWDGVTVRRRRRGGPVHKQQRGSRLCQSRCRQWLRGSRFDSTAHDCSLPSLCNFIKLKRGLSL